MSKTFNLDNTIYSIDNKVSDTFIWVLRDFNHFYKNPPHCTTAWSEAFHSPNMTNNNNSLLNQNNNHVVSTICNLNNATQNSVDDDINTMMLVDNPLDNTDEKDYYTWRLCLFPHGYKTEQYISLFLYAFQTDLEKRKGNLVRPVK